jgi:putative transposase
MHRPNTFSLLKRQLDQISVRKIIKNHEADKYCKGFDTYQHLMVMIFAQIYGCKSLRELEFVFNSHHQKHYHLGLNTVVRSTLSYANMHRGVDVFSDFLKILLHRLGRKEKAEIKDLVFLLDSTSITLKGHGFDDWTKATKNRCTQGLKLHVEYSLNDLLSTNNIITAPNVNDLSVAREMVLQSGATYVFDKAYCDYNWWLKIEEKGSHFVTRLKNNAAIKTIQTRPIPAEDSSIIEEDITFCFTNKHPRGGKKLLYSKPLRRVSVKRDDGKKILYLVTNDLDSKALQISETYKRRWLVELFFKWIKQNLRITRFMGHSETAVKIQIITALIAYTLIVALHKELRIYDTIREMLLMFKARLFHEISFEKPPPIKSILHSTKQLDLGLMA